MENKLKFEELFVGCELLHKESGDVITVRGLHMIGDYYVSAGDVWETLDKFEGILADVRWANDLVDSKTGESVYEYVESFESGRGTGAWGITIHEIGGGKFGCVYRHEVALYFRVNWGVDVVTSDEYEFERYY